MSIPRHDDLKLRILHNIINLLQVLLVIGVLAFEDGLEQLEVEDGLMRMGIVFEELDLSVLI